MRRDNVLVSGRLANGRVASIHVAANPWAGSGFRIEVYGRERTLVASGANSPQLERVHLQGAMAADKALHDIDAPDSYIYASPAMHGGEAFNVGQLYQLFAKAIRSGHPCQTNFDTAVSLHRFIDTVRAASERGRELGVAND